MTDKSASDFSFALWKASFISAKECRTQMTEMIERVAVSLIESMFAPHEVQSVLCDDDLMAKYREAARDAIKVMREPSQEQYDALCATNKIWTELSSYEVWTTYIDAASKLGGA
jgi:hypothetical protein